ncbi:MAG: methyltransferase [Candidatus Solibacter sp.]|jgi:SAM-dependent methyltransferase
MVALPDFCITLDYEVLEYPPESSQNRKPSFSREVIEPTKMLFDVAEQHGCAVTLFVEVAELAFWEEYGHDEIAAVREQIGKAYAQGHDVQLHLHPRWLTSFGARYDKHTDQVRWGTVRSLAELNHTEIDRVLGWATDYLRGIVSKVESSYSPVVFRAGKLQVQPHRPIFNALRHLGYEADSSACKGGYLPSYEGGVGFDFRHLWTEHRPYYPCPEDINLPAVLGQQDTLIELPIFAANGRQLSLDLLRADEIRDLLRGSDGSVAVAIGHSKIIGRNIHNIAAFLDEASTRFRFTRIQDSARRARSELTANIADAQRSRALAVYQSSLPDMSTIVSSLDGRRAQRVRDVASLIRQLLAVRDRIDVLDWNCGTGEGSTLALAAEFRGEARLEITGYDSDQASILRAELHRAPGVRFTSFPQDVQNERFDLVVCLDNSLSDSEGAPSLLAQVSKSVAPGGLLYVSIDRPSAKDVIRGFTEWTKMKVLSFPTLARLLVSAKLRILRSLSVGHHRLSAVTRLRNRPVLRVVSREPKLLISPEDLIRRAETLGLPLVCPDDANRPGMPADADAEGQRLRHAVLFCRPTDSACLL